MYNQVNRGSVPPGSLPPPPPLPPGYQQALPPPPPLPHYQHFAPPPPNFGGPPAPHVYLHGPPTTSSTVPLGSVGVMPNTGPSYAFPPRMHGMAPQSFPTLGQNSQHSSNLGVQSHHTPPPVPPPTGHSQQETSWAPGPPSRVLPPPPPPPSSSQGQILYNHPLPPPPPLRAPGPDGVYHHSTIGNYQVPSVAPPPPPPPPPTSPPPVPPSPPPITPAMTSTYSQVAHTDDPTSTKVFGFESKAVDSVDGVLASCPSGVAPVNNSDSHANQDGGSCGETADDMTLSDKDQGSSNYAFEVVTQQHDGVNEVFIANEKIQLLQSSTGDDLAKGILSSGASCFGSTGVSNQIEGIAWGSELPDGVISDILTKMGTKDLVRCSLISKRWLRECQKMMDLSFVLQDHKDATL